MITSNSPSISHFQGVIHHSHHTLHFPPGLARRLRHIFATGPSILEVKRVREAAERCTKPRDSSVWRAEQGTVAGSSSHPTQPFFIPYFYLSVPFWGLKLTQNYSLIFWEPKSPLLHSW